MKNVKWCILAVALLVLITCADENNKANQLVSVAIEAAGGERFDRTMIEFEFRGRQYGYKKKDGHFEYVRMFYDSTDLVRDVLTNDGFYREVNGERVAIPDTMAAKYTRSVNSVIYFALLPYGLNDAAVNKSYLGEKFINKVLYHKIKVTFDEEGGGEDHQDTFVYWINAETHQVDYLAYDYITDGGGQRFRKAYHERFVKGIRFVAYINYEPASSIPLEDMDEALEKGELKELSRIELENISVQPL